MLPIKLVRPLLPTFRSDSSPQGIPLVIAEFKIYTFFFLRQDWHSAQCVAKDVLGRLISCLPLLRTVTIDLCQHTLCSVVLGIASRAEAC